MANFPGPYELEFMISMGALIPERSHALRINCAVVGAAPAGALLADITLQTAGGGTKNAQAAADQAWSFFRLTFGTTVTCTSVTLWRYIPNTFAKDFVSAGAVALPAGSAGSVGVANQNTLTFRSANGSVMKLVFLETNIQFDTRTTLIPNPAGSQHQRIAAYILSADNVALARDDAYPIAALRVSGGQNERVWRKVFRGA